MSQVKPAEKHAMIDAHVHVFLQDMPLVPNPRHAPVYSFTVAQLIDILDAHGVDKAVIAAASPWGDYNDYVIESVRQHPARLRGTIIADPAKINAHEMREMDRDGICGVRLPFISLKELPDLNSWDYRKFLRRIADLDWHVHLHIEGERLPTVLPALLSQGVKVVVDHIGRLGPQDGVESAGFVAMAQAIEKRIDGRGDFTETVFQPLGKGRDTFLILNGIEFGVQVEPFLCVGDVLSGDQHFHIRLDGHVADVGAALGDFFFEQILEICLLQLLNRLVQDFLVRLKADVGDEARLLAAEQVARAPDVQISHGDLEARAEVREFFDGFQPLAGLLRERAHGRREQVAVGFLVAAPYPTPQLVQV